MKKIILFGGTTEGRELAEFLIQQNMKEETPRYDLHVCVATAYGAKLLPKADSLTIHEGRMEADAMRGLLREVSPDVCVDATHPYAVLVTENICRACAAENISYIRVRREDPINKVPASMDSSSDKVSGTSEIRSKYVSEACRQTDEEQEDHDSRFTDSVCVKDVQEAVDFLKDTTGNILITTGSKELAAYTQLPDYANRCTARILPTAEAVAHCEALGFSGKHLIGMQGPFDTETNVAALHYAHADWLVTKASGKAGGYEEKCEAARLAHANLLVIGRPEETVQPVMSPEEVKRLLGGDG